MAASCRFPLSASAGSVPGAAKKKKEEPNTTGGGGAFAEFFRTLRRDREFLSARLRSAADATAPVRERVSRALTDLVWLRPLEDPKLADRPHTSVAPPNISYQPGLSGMDLLLADLEALKLYAYYLQHASQIWYMPVPEVYDPQQVADYFSCRPHVLVFRILEVFSSFTAAAIKFQISRRFKMNEHGAQRGTTSAYYTGLLLKESMLHLGPTFVKIGQSLSTRPDLIGSEISEALSELHDKIPPFPRPVAMKMIEEEFGCPVESIFSYISEEPVAAASFGQVYRGCTLDGCTVAVKVQRPNLLHTVARDVYILRLGVTNKFLRIQLLSLETMARTRNMAFEDDGWAFLLPRSYHRYFVILGV